MKSTLDTKTAILDAAQELVQSKSFSGVSFQKLASMVGIKKGSMYHHFASKDELTIALLDRVHDQMKAAFDSGQGKPALKRLNYYLKIYRHYIVPGKNMCPVGAFVGEWGAMSNEVKFSIRRNFKMQLSSLTDIVRSGVESGEFTPLSSDPDTVATWILATVQGSLSCDRVFENDNTFQLSSKLIFDFLTANRG